MSDKIPPVKIRRATGLKIPERKAKKILRELANGRSVRSICREFKTSHHVVNALRINRAADYAKVRAQLRDEWATLAAIGTGELLSRIEGMETRTLLVTAGVSADKALLLEGTTAATVEPTAQPSADAWAEFVAGFKAENPPQGQ
jgi:DNA-binding CsgD family transcriptional regulator